MTTVTLLSEGNAYAESSDRNWVRRKYLIEFAENIPNKNWVWEQLAELKKVGKVIYKWSGLPYDVKIIGDNSVEFTPYLGSMD